MADFPIYRLVKGNTLTFTEMDDNLRWLSRNMSGSTVTITGSAIDMSGSVSIIGDVQITGTASIGFIKSEGYSTGSNQLGDDTSDRQTLIGIVSVSGSMSVFGNSVMTGSLAQGSKTIASGRYSHAEGSSSIAIEIGSHAEGLYTIASGAYQHVQGQYNATSSVQSAFIVGNGTDDNNRSNLIFAANNTVQITGSLKVLGSITGSLFGTASNAVSSSYALSASYAVSSSYAYTASSAISAYTASSSVSSSYAYTASSAISAYTASSSVSSSYAYTASSAISAYTASSSISSSYAYTASSAISAYTASSSVSSSYAYTASSAISAYTASSSVSSSYSITASHAESLKIGLNLSASSINITNNIVANSITAQSASFGYVQTITGSAVIIGQEYIVLNTQTPSSRYAGLIIYDSGSSTTTASLVWDSQTNHFVYSNGSGSSYSGGGFIAGPKNSGSLADATYPTLNRVLRGQGDDHIYDSNITDDNSKVSVSIPVNVTGSVTATTGFTGSLFGTASRAISSSYALTSSYSTNISGTTNYVSKFTGINSLGNSLVYDDGTNVGINTASPGYRLDVQGTGRYSSNLTVDGYIGINATAQAPYRILAGGMIRTQGAGNSGRIEIVDTQVGGASLTIDPQRSLGIAAIYTNGAFPIAIGTNNTDRLSINGTGTIKLNSYTTNGFVKFSSSDGTLAVDTTTYQPILTNPITGSGTINYVPKWSSTSSLGNSLVYDNGTSVMINTTSSHSSYSNPRLVVSDASNAYLEVRSVNNQSSLVLSKGTSDTSTTPSVEFFNSGRFGIVMYRPGVVGSNYMMYYDSDSVSNRSLTFQTEGSDRLTLNQTGTVRLNSYTTNGFVKFSGSNGTLAVDTTTYQPLLNGSGYVSMSGTNVNYVSTIPNSGLTNSSITIQGSVTSLGGSVNVINGTGFVKASGTSVTYDNSTYYLASNPSGYTTNTGTLTSVTVTAGTGMSGGGTLTGAGGTVTLTNAAPDQVVALTQGGTTVITGTYPNFTITSNDQYTGTVTGTGTANYLSKFTGTSAIGNSIVYDNGTNVGIGTSTPAAKFVVSNGGASGLEIDPIGGVGSGVLFQAYNRSTSAYMAQSYYALSHTFNVGSGGATRVVDITSGGNVGIGTTSPAAKLHVDDGTGAALFVGLASNIYYRAYEHIWQSLNGTFERMRIDPNGNLGLGVTPSAWFSVRSVFQIGQAASFSSSTNSIVNEISSNAIIDATATDKYIVTNFASRYRQNVGQHQWFNAPSGTAGNAITFTQAMTLTSGGNLLVGTTTDAGFKLDVNGTARVSGDATLGGDIYLTRATTPAIISTTNQPIRFVTNGFTSNFTTSGVFNTPTGLRTDGFVQTVNLAVGASYYNTAAPTNGAIIQGNVGIGTTSPTTKLEIYSGSGDNYIYTTNGTAATFNGLMVRYNSTNYMGAIGNPSSGEFRIGGFNVSGYYTTIYSNNSETVRVTAGNVGIGTTSPNSNGGASARVVHINSSGVGDWAVTHYTNGSTGFNQADGLIVGSIGSDAYIFNYENSPILFGTNSTEQMRITSGGNVGIGTTSPAAKLDVSGNILANNFNSDNAVVNTADTYTGTAKITNIITLTQAEYNAIGSPSSNYLYVII